MRKRGRWFRSLVTIACVAPVIAIGAASCSEETAQQNGAGPTGSTGATSTGGAGTGGAGATGGAGTAGAGATGGPGGAGGAGGQGGVGPGGAGGQGGGATCTGIGPGASLDACDDCLDTDCHDELCACGDACVDIEACLETVCRALLDAAEDGASQVYCQGQHPGGKDLHLAVVNCAYAGTCIPPCAGYPTDWESCRATMTVGACGDELAACQGSVQCLAYQACTDACTTSSQCIGCGATVDGATGRLLLEAYERCVASECIAEAWAH